MNVTDFQKTNWELRVTRTGFLQSKIIASEGPNIGVTLSGKIKIKYNNQLWVNDICLYDDDMTITFPDKMRDAFVENEEWALPIIDHFEKISPLVDSFVHCMKGGSWKNNPVNTYTNYVSLLHQTQKYYVLAVPLTNYCEAELREYPDIIADHAVSYRPLDIDQYAKSTNPLEEFAWVKTAYNVIEELTADDVIEHTEQTPKETIPIPPKISHFVSGLQIGIYARNRMKELSQKLWYYIEDLAQHFITDWNISRDDFYTATWQEIVASMEAQKFVVSTDEITKRKAGYICGIYNSTPVIVTGPDVQTLTDFVTQTHSDEVKGRTACKGEATGYVKVIRNAKEFTNFKQGDILVTAMTTPDFIVLMKKAAAIVTDEGGLSCHAAIVSRELQIPCIIGTKNATSVLKTGERVFVDATNGTVTKK